MIIFSFKQLPERLKLLPLQVVGNHYIYNHYWYISYRVGCFHLILRFAKSFIQVGSLSSNLTSLFGIKFENVFIIVSLKTEVFQGIPQKCTAVVVNIFKDVHYNSRT